MTDKGINPLDVLLDVQCNLSPLEVECTSFSLRDKKDSKLTGNANRNKQKLCYCQRKNVSGKTDTVSL